VINLYEEFLKETELRNSLFPTSDENEDLNNELDEMKKMQNYLEIEEMKKLNIEDLHFASIHKGHYLRGRIINKARRIYAIYFLLEDELKNVVKV
jgi:hypothetical protein